MSHLWSIGNASIFRQWHYLCSGPSPCSIHPSTCKGPSPKLVGVSPRRWGSGVAHEGWRHYRDRWPGDPHWCCGNLLHHLTVGFPFVFVLSFLVFSVIGYVIVPGARDRRRYAVPLRARRSGISISAVVWMVIGVVLLFGYVRKPRNAVSSLVG